MAAEKRFRVVVAGSQHGPLDVETRILGDLATLDYVELSSEEQLWGHVDDADASRVLPQFLPLHPSLLAIAYALEELSVMIINVDRKARSVQLSLKAKDAADQQEAMASLNQQAAQNAGTTSLGALLRAKLDNNGN